MELSSLSVPSVHPSPAHSRAARARSALFSMLLHALVLAGAWQSLADVAEDGNVLPAGVLVAYIISPGEGSGTGRGEAAPPDDEAMASWPGDAPETASAPAGPGSSEDRARTAPEAASVLLQSARTALFPEKRAEQPAQRRPEERPARKEAARRETEAKNTAAGEISGVRPPAQKGGTVRAENSGPPAGGEDARLGPPAASGGSPSSLQASPGGFAAASGGSGLASFAAALPGGAPFGFPEGAVDAKPVAIRKTSPLYPESARRRRLNGEVVVRFHLDERGNLSHLHVKSAEPSGVFENSALTAVRQWRFSPARKDGRNVPVWVEKPLRFELR